MQAVEMFMGGQLYKPKYIGTTMDSGIICERTIDLDAVDTPTIKENGSAKQTKDLRISKAASVMGEKKQSKMQSVGTEAQRVGWYLIGLLWSVDI